MGPDDTSTGNKSANDPKLFSSAGPYLWFSGIGDTWVLLSSPYLHLFIPQSPQHIKSSLSTVMGAMVGTCGCPLPPSPKVGQQ